ncbi:hypothetical protein M409DRAFT_71367 [Zasmidium cellare ATCC 36951]|uniref:ubiquitinyl hydrolase 1 n=1 Tax=Zasmidium cellare ATCC 36951 TaxID=1080233 RepID=A0A6A6BWI9_ZASCE|nr:uncharacterized protein M409DRAFT_71367 [Zasmidium cellare ATCC 36951]KAF2158953.1 hypothetical protein M409DRAFT_71367 [Zasmidium cellare ATCC 36951]
MAGGGILLMQLEHILSFQLIGLERYTLGDDSIGRSLVQTQRFFDRRSRDIVDESDENFSDAVLAYITKPDVTNEEIGLVENSGPNGFFTESIRPTLFLLRGLLARGVLGFVFGRKRWRVNYGLDTSRTPPTRLAVPYRAKDMPTSRSEFSHPNVVILLTLLCYYYGGLTDDHLFASFAHLLDTNQRDVEFQTWIQGAPKLPPTFRQLEGINLKDRAQCKSLVFPALRFNKRVVNYFLSHIVFPKEMKEFPHKLSASGWDIGKIKDYPTTAFSRTSNSQALLPLDVTYLDLPNQQHTNALVLDYLLQAENSVAFLPAGDLARTWLNMHTTESTRGVVFLNDSDEIVVLNREGFVEPLQTSAFANQLETCLVFLDEAHTRGTDLRLPQDYRAAVTLGANVTKDRLVQACIRMRKLGKGQTVVFCVTEEIRTKILESRPATREGAEVSVSDVLHWSICETFSENLGETSLAREWALEFLEDEAQDLESRYRPRKASAAALSTLASSSNPRNNLIANRCLQFEELEFHGSTLQEEQERELSPEIQQERQVQRPPAVDPVEHHIHPDMRTFVSTGVVEPCSEAYMPAFTVFSSIRTATSLDVSQLGGKRDLLVTADFARTVKKAGASNVSDANVVDCVMVVSPHEAQQLYPHICQSSTVVLHVYKPRWNVGFRSLDHLQFFTIPSLPEPRVVRPSLLTQLNLFAGQLACDFLGLASTKADGRCTLAADGFILQASDEAQGTLLAPRISPVPFLKEIMKIRKNSEGIGRTHVGSMLDGVFLTLSDFAAL